MTFEEWAIKRGFKQPEQGIRVSYTQYALMQKAWNAAIKAAAAALAREYYYTEEGEDCRIAFPEHTVLDLLTDS